MARTDLAIIFQFSLCFNCTILISTTTTTEITGSETFVHVKQGDLKLVVLTHGVHRVDIGDTISVYMNPSKFFIFDADDALVSAPIAGVA